METVEIVVGIVEKGARFLVQPRAGDPALAGLWELPGGKVEPGEDHHAALAREVEEETGIAVRVGDLACALCHEYPDRRVALWAYLCEPVGAARPPRWTEWVTAAEYAERPIPEANVAIAEALLSPARTVARLDAR